jgi:hypothetical protein
MGQHTLRLAETRALRPGLYFARLRVGPRKKSVAKVVVTCQKLAELVTAGNWLPAGSSPTL